MNKRKLMGFLLVVASVIFVVCAKKTCVYANEWDIKCEVSDTEGNIWVEAGETYWTPCNVRDDSALEILSLEKGRNNLNTFATRADYTSYQFSHTDNIWTTNSAGKAIKLFSHTISGTVFFYTDGKVHLFSLDSDTSNVRFGYSAKISERVIVNTDGTVSLGLSEVETKSLIYPTPKMAFSVTFTYGSAQAAYEIIEY